MNVAQRFAVWTGQLRLARVRRIWISTPAFDDLATALMGAGAHVVAFDQGFPVDRFHFNGVLVLRRERFYVLDSPPQS